MREILSYLLILITTSMFYIYETNIVNKILMQLLKPKNAKKCKCRCHITSRSPRYENNYLLRKTVSSRYKQVWLSILKISSSINTKTNNAERTRNVKHIGVKFWLKLTGKNANYDTNTRKFRLETCIITSAICTAIHPLTRLYIESMTWIQATQENIRVDVFASQSVLY